MRPVTLKFKTRTENHGVHVRFDVFAGPDADHLALAGTMVFRTAEAVAFTELLRAGKFWLERDAAEDAEVSAVEVVLP